MRNRAEQVVLLRIQLHFWQDINSKREVFDHVLPPRPPSNPFVPPAASLAGLPVVPRPEEVEHRGPQEPGVQDEVEREERTGETAEDEDYEPCSHGQGLETPSEWNVQRGKLDSKYFHS